MSNKELKKIICEAIEADPNKEDILKVSLFGSQVYGNPQPDSDVDVLIEFRPNAPIGLFEFVRIQRRFSEFSGKKIDLLTPSALSKYFREEVLNNAKTIYEK